MANNLKAPSNMRRCIKFSFYINLVVHLKAVKIENLKCSITHCQCNFFCSDGANTFVRDEPSTFISKLKKLDIEY